MTLAIPFFTHRFDFSCSELERDIYHDASMLYMTGHPKGRGFRKVKIHISVGHCDISGPPWAQLGGFASCSLIPELNSKPWVGFKSLQACLFWRPSGSGCSYPGHVLVGWVTWVRARGRPGHASTLMAFVCIRSIHIPLAKASHTVLLEVELKRHPGWADIFWTFQPITVLNMGIVANLKDESSGHRNSWLGDVVMHPALPLCLWKRTLLLELPHYTLERVVCLLVFVPQPRLVCFSFHSDICCFLNIFYWCYSRQCLNSKEWS